MATVAEALALGLRCHQSGNLAEAAQIYREILQTAPDNARVLALLGIAALGQNQLDGAIDSLKHALRLDPDRSDVWNNLGVACARHGKPEEALASFQQALHCNPDYAEAACNLGDAARSLEHLTEAGEAYGLALRLKPDYARALNGLGVLQVKQGNLDEAVASFKKAVRLKPSSAEAWNNLALALARKDDFEDAVACCRKAIQLQPENGEFYNNLGLIQTKQVEKAAGLGDALARQGKLDDALAAYQKALALLPDSFELHQNLGVALHEADQFEAAVASYHRALQLKPDYAQAHNNLAIALMDLGQFDEAVASCREAIRLNPDYADAHKNLGLTLLTLGAFEEGWREYEWRLRCADNTARTFAQPLWDGSSLAGKTILLHAEQGLGDTLQFIRYAALVKQHGGTVWVECQKPLTRILGGCPGIDRLFAQGSDLPLFDVQAPLVSLPGILRTSVQSIPAQIPYLFAEPRLMDEWRNRLREVPERKIGINWQGSIHFRRSRHRSAPLGEMLRLREAPGVRLISLQKGPAAAELKSLPEAGSVLDLADALDENTAPFLDTAAVLMNLDLFVTSDTAVAHLAGALGVPVWLVLPFSADWRWFLHREDSPWYPGMRLFRQRKFGDWPEVFRRVLAELKKMLVHQ